MAKNPSASESDSLSFEESLTTIQDIVKSLEDGTLDLDESLKQFEVGIKLIRQCHTKLEQAEQQIKILVDVDADGNPALADFDGSATIQANKKTAGRRKKSAPEESDENPADGSSLF